MTTINNTFTKLNETVTVQFGNPGDSSGYEIAQAKLLGSVQRMIMVYLVQKGNLFGIATGARDGNYYCTTAVTVGSRYTPEDAARMLGVPLDAITDAMNNA